MKEVYEKKIEGLNRKNELLIRWVKNLHNYINVADYLLEKRVHEIAVYGFNGVAERFIDELKNSSVQVRYIIDRNPGYAVYDGIETVGLADNLKNVDLIVVAVVEYYEQVESDLRKITKIPIVALDDLIFSA